MSRKSSRGYEILRESLQLETLLPGAPWHALKDKILKTFVENITPKIQGGDFQERRVILKVLGGAFVIRYFPQYSQEYLSNKSHIDKDTAEKLEVEAELYLQGEMMKAANDQGENDDKDTSCNSGMSDEYMIFAKETYRKCQNWVNKIGNHLNGKSAEKRKMGREEFDLQIISPRRELTYSTRRSTNWPGERSIIGDDWTECSLKTGNAMRLFLEDNPKRIPDVCVALRTLILPSTLRPLIWTEVLQQSERHRLGIGKRESIEKQLRERFDNELSNGLREFNITDATQSPIAKLIETSVTDTMALSGITGNYDTFSKETINVLNVFYTCNRFYEPYHVHRLYPLQIAFTQKQQEIQHTYNLCMFLTFLLDVYPRWPQIQICAENVIKLLYQYDPKLFGFLDNLSCNMESPIDNKIIVEMLHVEKLRGRGIVASMKHNIEKVEEIESIEPLTNMLIFVRKWIGDGFVGILETAPMMLVWDLLFMTNFENATFENVCFALMLLLKSTLQDVETFKDLKNILLNMPCRLYTKDIQSAIQCAMKGDELESISDMNSYRPPPWQCASGSDEEVSQYKNDIQQASPPDELPSPRSSRKKALPPSSLSQGTKRETSCSSSSLPSLPSPKPNTPPVVSPSIPTPVDTDTDIDTDDNDNDNEINWPEGPTKNSTRKDLGIIIPIGVEMFRLEMRFGEEPCMDLSAKYFRLLVCIYYGNIKLRALQSHTIPNIMERVTDNDGQTLYILEFPFEKMMFSNFLNEEYATSSHTRQPLIVVRVLYANSKGDNDYILAQSPTACDIGYGLTKFESNASITDNQFETHWYLTPGEHRIPLLPGSLPKAHVRNQPSENNIMKTAVKPESYISFNSFTPSPNPQGRKKRREHIFVSVPLNAIWIPYESPTPTSLPLAPDNSVFDIYVDGVRWIPDNASFAVVTITLMPEGENNKYLAYPLPKSPARNPEFKTKIVINDTESTLNAKTLLFVKCFTMDTNGIVLCEVGSSILPLFQIVNNKPTLDVGGYQLPLKHGKADPKVGFGVESFSKNPRCPGLSALIRILPHTDDHVEPPSYDSGYYKSSDCVPNSSEIKAISSFLQYRLFPTTVLEAVKRLQENEISMKIKVEKQIPSNHENSVQDTQSEKSLASGENENGSETKINASGRQSSLVSGEGESKSENNLEGPPKVEENKNCEVKDETIDDKIDKITPRSPVHDENGAVEYMREKMNIGLTSDCGFIDLKGSVHYDVAAGVQIKLENGYGLSNTRYCQLLATVHEGYESREIKTLDDAKLPDDMFLTDKLNYSSKLTAPSWNDEEFTVYPQYDENTCLLLQVIGFNGEYLRDKSGLGPGEVKPPVVGSQLELDDDSFIGWTAVQLFRNMSVNSAVHMLPLFEGKPSELLLSNISRMTVEKSMKWAISKATDKLHKFHGSVKVSIWDGHFKKSEYFPLMKDHTLIASLANCDNFKKVASVSQGVKVYELVLDVMSKNLRKKGPKGKDYYKEQRWYQGKMSIAIREAVKNSGYNDLV